MLMTKKSRENKDLPKTLEFSTGIVRQILINPRSAAYHYSLKGLELFSYALTLVTLCVVDIKKKEIRYYNSLNNQLDMEAMAALHLFFVSLGMIENADFDGTATQNSTTECQSKRLWCLHMRYG
jgi:hypothetical protein